jgi:glycosyltransferase involved in cell wall biosynthesis
MNNPFFSIIIPTLNEEDNLPVLLKSIQDQTFRDFEVVVVDGGSTDSTKVKTLGFQNKIPHLQFVEHKCRNVGAGRNHGASLAKADILVFFDADVEIEPVFLERIRSHIRENQLDMLTVWNRTKDKGWQGRVILNLLNFNMELFQKIKPGANGPCMIVKKDIFKKVKGFDETIVFGEDFDLTQKVHKSGGKFAVFKEPVLYVSTRRFEKEGLFLSLYKAVKALLYQLIFGPIRKPIFDYKMGGEYFEKKKDQSSKETA